MPIIASFVAGGGVSNTPLNPVKDVQIIEASDAVYIKWQDPEDLITPDETIVEWKGTLLVRKAGSVPKSHRDGVTVVNNTVRNAYSNEYFCDAGLRNGIKYYYKFFPYTTTNIRSNNKENEFSAVPSSYAPNNVDSISATSIGGIIYLSWTDPEDIKSDGVTVSEWAGTKVVYKMDDYPTSVDDGALIINSTTRNTYKDAALSIEVPIIGETYHIALFPYSTDGTVNTSAENMISVTTSRIALIDSPAQSGSLTYNGGLQSPSWANYNESSLIIGGTTSAVDAGTYVATFTPKDEYCWNDGSSDTKSFNWTIEKADCSFDVDSTSITLNNSNLTKVVSVTGADNCIITATSSNENVATASVNGTNIIISHVNKKHGSATITVGMAEDNNYIAQPNKTILVEANFPKTKTIPTQGEELTYNGSVQNPFWNDYDNSELAISGAVSGANAGTYVATFMPVSGYSWDDGSTSAKNVSWIIKKAVVDYPVQCGSLTYCGSAQSPIWNNYESTKMTIDGITNATDAGTYTATFVPTDNYCWSDMTANKIDVDWTINKALISIVPSQNGVLVYSGDSQEPIWSNHDSSQLTIDGAISATDTGTYVVTFTPTNNYCWSDGSTTEKSVSWTIKKATGNVKLDLDSIALSPASPSVNIAVTRFGTGEITASSSDVNIATASVSGDTVIVSSVNNTNGSTTITIDIVADENYTAASIECAVNANFFPIKDTFSNMSWADIQTVCKAGQAANYWSIGDEKEITLDGDSYTVNIIGFDHDVPTNASDYGRQKTGITCQLTESLADKYAVNNTATNSTGWTDSVMRQSSMVNLFDMLSDDLKDVIVPVNKATANCGLHNPVVTMTSDRLFLLSETEVKNINMNSAIGEGSQYEYYSAGNSIIKTMEGNAVTCWLRSPCVGNETDFCCVTDVGDISNMSADLFAGGIAPAFCI